MSLINQMLKDLEARHAPEMGGEAVLRDLSITAPRARGNRGLGAVMLGIGAAAIAIGSAGYWYLQRSQLSVSVADPVVERVLPVAKADSSGMAPMAATEVPEKPEIPVAKLSPSPSEMVSDEPAKQSAASSTKPGPAVSERTKVTPVATRKVEPAKEKPPVESVIAATDSVTAPVAIVERVNRPRSNVEKAHVAYLQGTDLVKQGRMGNAESRLHEALELNPALNEAREVLAALLIRANRSQEAEQLLKSGLASDKRAYTLARLYGRLLAERDAGDLAIEVLEASLPAPELDPDYYGLLAALYQRSGRHELAAEAYRRVLAVKPDQGVWWTGLAISLERLRRTEEAVPAYRRARSAAGMTPQLLTFVEQRVVALTAQR